MPVNVHVADPIWMYQKMDETNDGMMNAVEWRLDDKPGIVDHSGMIDVLERAVRRHPRTTFVACHLANLDYDLARLGAAPRRLPNLYADISARYAETAVIPRVTARFFTKYQDRLVYGTDMGFDADMYRTTFRILETRDEHFYAPIFEYHWSYSGFGLQDPVLEKLYRTNALRVRGAALRPGSPRPPGDEATGPPARPSAWRWPRSTARGPTRDGNLERMAGWAERAKAAARSSSPSPSFASRASARTSGWPRVTETLDGPSVASVRALARRLGLAIGFGFSEKADGKPYNAYAVVEPDGRSPASTARTTSRSSRRRSGRGTRSGPSSPRSAGASPSRSAGTTSTRSSSRTTRARAPRSS